MQGCIKSYLTGGDRQKRFIGRLHTCISRAEEGSASVHVMEGTLHILTYDERKGLAAACLPLGIVRKFGKHDFLALTEILEDEKLATQLYADMNSMLHAHKDIGRRDTPWTIELPAFLRTDAHPLGGLSLADSIVHRRPYD